MNYKIYVITNTLNGDQYVGMTSRPVVERVGEHFQDARKGSSSVLHDAMREFGFRAFDYAMIDGASNEEEARKIERWWISALNTFEGRGYNDTSGGDDFGNDESPDTKSTKQKMCVSMSSLSPEQASEVKWLANKDIEYSEIANQYPISEPSVCKINTGTTWSHIAPKRPEDVESFLGQGVEESQGSIFDETHDQIESA